jgi:type I restriction enzyme, S subunit
VSDLPQGWAMAPLQALGSWTGGGTPSKQVAGFWNGKIPWVSPKDMKVPRIRETQDHITSDAIEQSSTALVPAGSILVVTRSGILRHSLPVAVVEREVALNQDLKALTVHEGIVPEYVSWALRASAGTILSTCAKSGTTVNNIDTARLLDFEIPIAPTAEQGRIVAAIDEHFSRLDAVEVTIETLVGRIDRGRGRIGALRHAILTQAFSGKLVPQDPSDEPAAVLLERIAAARAAEPKPSRRQRKIPA